jgi:hypothetical protein
MADSVDMPFDSTGVSTGGLSLDGLLPALRRLDRLLEQAMAAAQVVYGPEPRMVDVVCSS